MKNAIKNLLKGIICLGLLIGMTVNSTLVKAENSGTYALVTTRYLSNRHTETYTYPNNSSVTTKVTVKLSGSYMVDLSGNVSNIDPLFTITQAESSNLFKPFLKSYRSYVKDGYVYVVVVLGFKHSTVTLSMTDEITFKQAV